MSGIAFSGSSMTGAQPTGRKPGGDMRKFFVGEGRVRWCRWPVIGLGGVDVRGVMLPQKTQRPEGGAWVVWGAVSVSACGAWRGGQTH